MTGRDTQQVPSPSGLLLSPRKISVMPTLDGDLEIISLPGDASLLDHTVP